MKINIRLVTLIVAIALSATPCEVLAKCRGSNLIGSYSSTSNTNDSFYLQSDSDEAMDNAIDNSGALVKALPLMPIFFGGWALAFVVAPVESLAGTIVPGYGHPIAKGIVSGIYKLDY